MALVPLKTKVNGPAAIVPMNDWETKDIIDEAIDAYRPNILFKNYEI
jgi:actin related protein 2/3 complex subunit 3